MRIISQIIGALWIWIGVLCIIIASLLYAMHLSSMALSVSIICVGVVFDMCGLAMLFNPDDGIIEYDPEDSFK